MSEVESFVRREQALSILDTLAGCSAISAVKSSSGWFVRVEGGPEHWGSDLTDALGQASQALILNREAV